MLLQYVFNNGQMDLERLKVLANVVGKQRLILDLSCRKKVCKSWKIKFYFQSWKSSKLVKQMFVILKLRPLSRRCRMNSTLLWYFSLSRAFLIRYLYNSLLVRQGSNYLAFYSLNIKNRAGGSILYSYRQMAEIQWRMSWSESVGFSCCLCRWVSGSWSWCWRQKVSGILQSQQVFWYIQLAGWSDIRIQTWYT